MKKCVIALIFIFILNMFVISVNAENEYIMLDISSAANGRVYLDNSENPGGNVSWSSVSPSDVDYMILNSNTNNRFAIQTSSIEALLTDGIIKDSDDVPYSIGLDKVISLRNGVSSEIVYDIEDDYYQNIYFLYADLGGISSGIKVVAEYSDGTKTEIDNLSFKTSYISSSTSTDSDIVGIANRYNSFNKQDFRLLQYVGIFRNSFEVNSEKITTSIKFVTTSDYELEILAMTAKAVGIEQLASVVQNKINNIEAEKEYLKELKVLIDKLRNEGYDVTTLNGYSEFLVLYEEIAAEKRYVFADISKSANSKVFLDGTPPGKAVEWSDFVTNNLDGVLYNGEEIHRLCAQTSAVESILTDGKFINAENVPYDMPLKEVITVSQNASVVTLNLKNRAYDKLYFLAASYGTSMDMTVNYTDGETQTETINVETCYDKKVGGNIVIAPPMYVAWNGGSFSKAISFGIREFSVTLDNTKEADSITFENINARDIKIISATLLEASNTNIKNGVAGSIANLKTNGDYLNDINENLELLKERGVSIDDIEGLDSFYDALSGCVYISSVTEKTDFENTTISISFLNPIAFDLENYTITKNGEKFSGYEIEAADEKTVQIVFPNVMDYKASYEVKISEETSSADSFYKLGKDEIYKIKVLPPLEVKNTSLSGSRTNPVFEAELINNTENFISCKVVVAIYTKDGEMLDSLFESKTVIESGDIYASLSGYNTEDALTVECYVVNDYESLEYLYPLVTVEI